MLNYQKLHYDHYYVMNEIGETTACSRAECFAPATYLPQCPYRQRWFYDPEAGYAVRLPRNHKGDESCPDSLCQSLSGTNTIWIRRSMTAASGWT